MASQWWIVLEYSRLCVCEVDLLNAAVMVEWE